MPDDSSLAHLHHEAHESGFLARSVTIMVLILP
jgi:hypothetical protein